MYKLPDLPYDYSALEPAISRDIMQLHHQKHHQGYVNKLNAAVEGTGLDDLSIEDLLARVDSLPESIRQTVVNNGGGHYNHSQFWQWMSPEGGGRPKQALLGALEARYGGFDEFVDKFTVSATGLFGSGWVWLMPNLDIVTTANQDNPIMEGQPAPILGLDVWEHAYYLDYYNRREQYVEAWWRVVDWEVIDYTPRV